MRVELGKTSVSVQILKRSNTAAELRRVVRMTTSPIFKSTDQALHVSFLVTSLPATQKSIMQSIYEANIGTPSEERAINAHGLNLLEFRGQCAMVCQAVDTHLGMQPERDAIKAFLGYQLIKAAGVRGIAQYMEPVIGYGGGALLATAWHVFGTKEQRKGLSAREIGDEYGLSKDRVARAASRMHKTAHDLRNRGVSGLDEYFKSTGLVEDF